MSLKLQVYHFGSYRVIDSKEKFDNILQHSVAANQDLKFEARFSASYLPSTHIDTTFSQLEVDSDGIEALDTVELGAN